MLVEAEISDSEHCHEKASHELLYAIVDEFLSEADRVELTMK